MEARRTSRTPAEPVRKGQLNVAWDNGSTLTMLLADGDRVRLLAPGAAPAPPAHRPRRRPAGDRAQAGREAGPKSATSGSA